MKRRIISVVLAGSMMLGLVACSAGNEYLDSLQVGIDQDIIDKDEAEELTVFLSENITADTQAVMPEGEMTEGQLPEGELPEGEIPEGEIPEGEIPEGEIPEGELSEGELPEGELPEGEIPEGEIPEGEIPEGEIPEGEIPEGELSEGMMPEGMMSGMESVEVNPFLGAVEEGIITNEQAEELILVVDLDAIMEELGVEIDTDLGTESSLSE